VRDLEARTTARIALGNSAVELRALSGVGTPLPPRSYDP
jgi:hypothetical protein